jgi:hypothetical protein
MIEGLSFQGVLNVTTAPYTTSITPVKSSSLPSHLEKFFERVSPDPARIMFAVDATASRDKAWDQAAHLRAQMFDAIAAHGGLAMQVCHYRGNGKFARSQWLTNAAAIAAFMAPVRCEAGVTQIEKVLRCAREENRKKPVNALILISDACEENPELLYAQAREIGLPIFLFQEGDDCAVAEIYREVARLTKGAYSRFDASAAQHLADLLRAVAVFATAGAQGLIAQKSTAATLLLGQIKK